MLAEFSLVAVVLEPIGRCSSWSRTVLEAIESVYRLPQLCQTLLTDPRSVVAHCWVNEGLSMLGLPLPLGASLLKRCIERYREVPLSQHSWSSLEASYLYFRATRRFGWQVNHVAPDVALHLPADSFDLYGLTHTVLFASDFGAQDWPLGAQLCLSQRSRLISELAAGAAVCRTARHYDLLAEIIAAAHCLRLPLPVADWLGDLRDAQGADGSIAGWFSGSHALGHAHGSLMVFLAECLLA
jgi:hypothetical protein